MVVEALVERMDMRLELLRVNTALLHRQQTPSLRTNGIATRGFEEEEEKRRRRQREQQDEVISGKRVSSRIRRKVERKKEVGERREVRRRSLFFFFPLRPLFFCAAG